MHTMKIEPFGVNAKGGGLFRTGGKIHSNPL